MLHVMEVIEIVTKSERAGPHDQLPLASVTSILFTVDDIGGMILSISPIQALYIGTIEHNIPE